MVIGTDISLAVCKDESYMMMEFDGRKPVNPSTSYNFFRTYPLDMQETGKVSRNERLVDVCYTITDLIELYANHKAGVDSFIGTEYPLDPKEYTRHRQVLNLASDLDMYCGL